MTMVLAKCMLENESDAFERQFAEKIVKVATYLNLKFSSQEFDILVFNNVKQRISEIHDKTLCAGNINKVLRLICEATGLQIGQKLDDLVSILMFRLNFQ